MITLEWEEVPGAASYEIELSPVKGKNLYFKSKTPEWSGSVSIGKYQLRIRGLDHRGAKGEWSEAQELYVQLLPPEAISPKHKNKIKTDENEKADVEFRWQRLADADSYQIEVFDKEQQKVFTEQVSDTKINVTLPVAKEYTWRVSAVMADMPVEELESSAELNSFSLYGKKLEKAKIEKPDTKFVTELKWTPVPHAERYAYLLQRKDKKKGWQVIERNENTSTSGLNVNTEYPGGNYKLTVKAYANLRPNSEASDLEFYIYEGKRTESAIEQAKKKEAIESEYNKLIILSYLISSLKYQGTNLESGQSASYNALGGTGRVGFGYLKPKSKWGFLGILDLSGVVINNKNNMYSSMEISAVYRTYFASVTQLRFYGGIFTRDIPEVIGESDSTSNVKNITLNGLQGGFQIWQPVTYKFGLQLNGQVLFGASGKTPNGQPVVPSASYQLGVLGSYKMKDNMTGFAGVAFRQDRAKYKAISDANSTESFAREGDVNEVQMTGTYLNLYLEYGF